MLKAIAATSHALVFHKRVLASWEQYNGSTKTRRTMKQDSKHTSTHINTMWAAFNLGYKVPFVDFKFFRCPNPEKLEYEYGPTSNGPSALLFRDP